MEKFKTIERHCMDCGSSIKFPVPKKEGGEVVHCCDICSLPHKFTLKLVRTEIPKYFPDRKYQVYEFDVSIDFIVTEKEFGKPNPVHSNIHIERRKKHLGDLNG